MSNSNHAEEPLRAELRDAAATLGSSRGMLSDNWTKVKTRTKVILASISLVVLALVFDWHLFLFDRPQYLLRRAEEKCAAVELANYDYHECRTVGYRDERCEYFRALSIEKAGECEAAHAAVEAEAIRHRAR